MKVVSIEALDSLTTSQVALLRELLEPGVIGHRDLAVYRIHDDDRT